MPSTILGQDQALALLRAAVRHQRVTTAYCFVGSTGIGKALTAQWFAQLLTCEHPTPVGDPCDHCHACHLNTQSHHPDVLWVEPTYNHHGTLLTRREAIAQDIQRRGVPQIRLEQIQAITRFTMRRPLRSLRSVVIIDGAETLAEPAANALLKTLEEPGHGLLVLVTPSLSDLLPTLISRCQSIPFCRLSRNHVLEILQRHGGGDNPPEALLGLAQGSPGRALDAWEHWHHIPSEILTAVTVWPQTVIEALTLGRQIARSLDIPTQLWLVDYWQHHLWQGDPRYRPYLDQLETIRQQLLNYVQPQLVWEMGLLPLS